MTIPVRLHDVNIARNAKSQFFQVEGTRCSETGADGTVQYRQRTGVNVQRAETDSNGLRRLWYTFQRQQQALAKIT